MAKMGRPLIHIDWDQVDKLCSIQCTKFEIASFLGISEETLENALKREKDCTFSTYYDQKSSFGKISLRRKQFQLAQSGNPTMLIWLGKQVLDQKEKTQTEHNLDPKLLDRVRELEALPDIELDKLINATPIKLVGGE